MRLFKLEWSGQRDRERGMREKEGGRLVGHRERNHRIPSGNMITLTVQCCLLKGCCGQSGRASLVCQRIQCMGSACVFAGMRRTLSICLPKYTI